MIWFFDSWIGGLTVMNEFRKMFPEFDFVYLGDTARCPYGGLDNATIRQYTEEWVERLFSEGAEVVILACNTATAHAIRYLQQERFPDRKILGVTIPGAERIVEGGYRRVGVLATESTVKNRAYRERVHILDDSIHIEEVAAPELVPLIESGIMDGSEIEQILNTHFEKFSDDLDAIVLGCTHYPYVRPTIEQIRPGLEIIDPGIEAAKKFREYLDRHPDIAGRIGKSGTEKRIWTDER